MKFIIDYFKQFGVNPDTTATILLTLIIFIAGIISTWLAGKIKEGKDKKSYRKSIKAILIEFQKSCNRQNELVHKSIDKIGLIAGKDFIVSFIPIGTLDYLTKIDLHVFLKNFEPNFPKKMYSKAISKLFDQLAVIRNQNESLEKDLKYFSDRFSVNEKNYQDNIEAIRRIIEELMVKFNGKELNIDQGGQLVQDCFDIISNWIKNGAKTNITDTYSEIVKPVHELGKIHKSIPLILPLTDHALKCIYAFGNIEKIEKFLISRYKKFAFAHRRASKLMGVILKVI